ncbi:hypothetical protein GCM10020358_67220 [Amorphoplanes nipponensis]
MPGPAPGEQPGHGQHRGVHAGRRDRRAGQVVAARLGEHEPALAALELGGDPVGREVGAHRQVDPAGLEDPQRGREPVQRAVQHHRHRGLGGQPGGQQGVRDPVGPGVQLAVRQGGRAVARRRPGGIGAYPLLEQLVERGPGQLGPAAGEPVQLGLHLGVGQQAAARWCGADGSSAAARSAARW